MFSRDVLRKAIARPHLVESETIICSLDLGYSTNDRADSSALAIGSIWRKDKEKHLDILDIVYGKFNTKELLFQIVRVVKKHFPDVLIIEENLGSGFLDSLLSSRFESLQDEGITPPRVRFRAPSRKKGAKIARFKKIQRLLELKRIHFAPGGYVDELFEQLERFDPTSRRNRDRKDDLPDSISQLIENSMKAA